MSETGWVTNKTESGREIDGLCYYQSKDLLVLTLSMEEDYKLPDDDNHLDWSHEGLLDFSLSVTISKLY